VARLAEPLPGQSFGLLTGDGATALEFRAQGGKGSSGRHEVSSRDKNQAIAYRDDDA
jgi:hypothetical protein